MKDKDKHKHQRLSEASRGQHYVTLPPEVIAACATQSGRVAYNQARKKLEEIAAMRNGQARCANVRWLNGGVEAAF